MVALRQSKVCTTTLPPCSCSACTSERQRQGSAQLSKGSSAATFKQDDRPQMEGVIVPRRVFSFCPMKKAKYSHAMPWQCLFATAEHVWETGLDGKIYICYLQPFLMTSDTYHASGLYLLPVTAVQNHPAVHSSSLGNWSGCFFQKLLCGSQIRVRYKHRSKTAVVETSKNIELWIWSRKASVTRVSN